jgi:hypothetical protein
MLINHNAWLRSQPRGAIYSNGIRSLERGTVRKVVVMMPDF